MDLVGLHCCFDEQSDVVNAKPDNLNGVLQPQCVVDEPQLVQKPEYEK